MLLIVTRTTKNKMHEVQHSKNQNHKLSNRENIGKTQALHLITRFKPTVMVKRKRGENHHLPNIIEKAMKSHQPRTKMKKQGKQKRNTSNVYERREEDEV